MSEDSNKLREHPVQVSIYIVRDTTGSTQKQYEKKPVPMKFSNENGPDNRWSKFVQG